MSLYLPQGKIHPILSWFFKECVSFLTQYDEGDGREARQRFKQVRFWENSMFCEAWRAHSSGMGVQQITLHHVLPSSVAFSRSHNVISLSYLSVFSFFFVGTDNTKLKPFSGHAVVMFTTCLRWHFMKNKCFLPFPLGKNIIQSYFGSPDGNQEMNTVHRDATCWAYLKIKIAHVGHSEPLLNGWHILLHGGPYLVFMGSHIGLLDHRTYWGLATT